MRTPPTRHPGLPIFHASHVALAAAVNATLPGEQRSGAGQDARHPRKGVEDDVRRHDAYCVFPAAARSSATTRARMMFGSE
jgi:hypothetical protein